MIQRIKWMPYLLTEFSDDQLEEDSCINSVTFCTNISTMEPITVSHTPFCSTKWCVGIHPGMVLECIISFAVCIYQPADYVSNCCEFSFIGGEIKLCRQRQLFAFACCFLVQHYQPLCKISCFTPA